MAFDKLGKGFVYFMRNLREKHRLSVRNQHNDNEVWYMHISPLNLIASFLALVAVLFVIIAFAVAYTPVLDLIPGYPGNKSRELLIENIMRLDSLDREIAGMQLHSENIALIMAGRNPVTRTVTSGTDSVSGPRDEFVGRVIEDSILRAQMEAAGGRYSLGDPDAARRALRSEMELLTPVKGVIASGFSPDEGRYGVTVATGIDQQVVAVMDGTVISSTWTPTVGHVIFIQHADNLMSVYRNNTGAIKKTGDRVRGGEVIASTGSTVTGAEPSANFEFELWHNGAPVDPQGYIVF